jgi:hypothetical protein
MRTYAYVPNAAETSSPLTEANHEARSSGARAYALGWFDLAACSAKV